MTNLMSSLNLDREDFETEASKIRTKIETYFSQLIEVIKLRKSTLISQLDNILSRYRKEREMNRDKMRELEKMRKFHEELYSTSTFNKLQDDVLSRINTELATLKQTMDSIVIEFEWNQKYASEVNNIGKLTCNAIGNSSSSDVTMKGADSSLFIFSKKLYEGLIYKTDVGPIPRDSYREEYLKSPFNNYVNWRVAIEGCYWCGKATNPNQYTYVCDKKCYQYFHEWCRRKLSEFCGEYLCMYPGCDESVVRDVKFCSETHQNNLAKKFKIIHHISVGKVVLKMPDWYQEDFTKQRSHIPQTDEHHHNHHQQQQQQQQQLPFILSEQLTQHLMEFTDIGAIPREILLDSNVLSQTRHYFLVRSNWNTIIQGCYWCLGDCSNNFASIFCCKECFFLFNEWSFKKLEGTPAVNCCKYLSCPESVTTPSRCCNKHSRKYSSEFGKLEHLLLTSKFILGPMWYHNGGLTEVDFYNRDEPFYEFTNFYPCPSLKINDVIFPTSERYFQSQKFIGSLTFSSGRKCIRPDWSNVKDDIMYKVLKEKFMQNPDLALLLISTCTAHLYMHTLVDSYWGDGGEARTGQNKLGLLLMKVRNELQDGNVYFPDTLSHHTYEELCNLVTPITTTDHQTKSSFSTANIPPHKGDFSSQKSK